MQKEKRILMQPYLSKVKPLFLSLLLIWGSFYKHSDLVIAAKIGTQWRGTNGTKQNANQQQLIRIVEYADGEKGTLA